MVDLAAIQTLVKQITECEDKEEKWQLFAELEKQLPMNGDLTENSNSIALEKQMKYSAECIFAILSMVDLCKNSKAEVDLYGKLIFKMVKMQKVWQQNLRQFERNVNNLKDSKQQKSLITLRQLKLQEQLFSTGIGFLSHLNNSTEPRLDESKINRAVRKLFKFAQTTDLADNIQQLNRLQFAAIILQKLNNDEFDLSSDIKITNFIRQLENARLTLSTTSEDNKFKWIKKSKAFNSEMEDLQQKKLQEAIRSVIDLQEQERILTKWQFKGIRLQNDDSSDSEETIGFEETGSSEETISSEQITGSGETIAELLYSLPYRNDLEEAYIEQSKKGRASETIKVQHYIATINVLSAIENLYIKGDFKDPKIRLALEKVSNLKDLDFSKLGISSSKVDFPIETERQTMETVYSLLKLQISATMVDKKNNLNKQPQILAFYQEAMDEIKNNLPADSAAKILQLQFVNQTIRNLQATYSKADNKLREKAVSSFYREWTENCKFMKVIGSKAGYDNLSDTIALVRSIVSDFRLTEMTTAEKVEQSIKAKAKLAVMLDMEPTEMLSKASAEEPSVSNGFMSIFHRSNKQRKQELLLDEAAEIADKMKNIMRKEENKEKIREEFQNWLPAVNAKLEQLTLHYIRNAKEGKSTQTDSSPEQEENGLIGRLEILEKRIPKSSNNFALEEDLTHYEELLFAGEEEQHISRTLCKSFFDVVTGIVDLVENARGTDAVKVKLSAIEQKILQKIDGLASRYCMRQNINYDNTKSDENIERLKLANDQNNQEFLAIHMLVQNAMQSAEEKMKEKDRKNATQSAKESMEMEDYEVDSSICDARKKIIQVIQENFPADTPQKQFMLRCTSFDLDKLNKSYNFKECESAEQKRKIENEIENWKAFHTLLDGATKLATPAKLSSAIQQVYSIIGDYHDAKVPQAHAEFFITTLGLDPEAEEVKTLLTHFRNTTEEIQRKNCKPKEVQQKNCAMSQIKREIVHNKLEHSSVARSQSSIDVRSARPNFLKHNPRNANLISEDELSKS